MAEDQELQPTSSESDLQESPSEESFHDAACHLDLEVVKSQQGPSTAKDRENSDAETSDSDAHPQTLQEAVVPGQRSTRNTLSSVDGIPEVSKDEASEGRATQSPTPSQDQMFIGDKATVEMPRSKGGNRSSPDGISGCQDDNGVRTRHAPVDLSRIKTALAKHDAEKTGACAPARSQASPSRRREQSPEGSSETTIISEDCSYNLVNNPYPPKYSNENEQLSPGEKQPVGRVASVDRSPPHYGRIINRGSEEHSNCSSFAGAINRENETSGAVCNTRTESRNRVHSQGGQCRERMKTLLERLREHKKEEKFYRLGVMTRNTSHDASYGGLYQALTEFDEQDVEAIRTQKHGSVHDSADKHFITDLAHRQLRVGHMVVYFSDPHHQRADIVQFLAEFHRDCPSCAPFLQDYH